MLQGRQQLASHGQPQSQFSGREQMVSFKSRTHKPSSTSWHDDQASSVLPDDGYFNEIPRLMSLALCPRDTSRDARLRYLIIISPLINKHNYLSCPTSYLPCPRRFADMYFQSSLMMCHARNDINCSCLRMRTMETLHFNKLFHSRFYERTTPRPNAP